MVLAVSRYGLDQVSKIAKDLGVFFSYRTFRYKGKEYFEIVSTSDVLKELCIKRIDPKEYLTSVDLV